MLMKRIVNVTLCVVVEDDDKDMSVNEISDNLDIRINGENDVIVKEYDIVEAFEIF